MVGDAEIFDRSVDGRVLRVGTPEMEIYLRAQLDRARRVLTTRGRTLLLLTIPCAQPSADISVPWAAVRQDLTRVNWVNAVWRRYAAEHAGSVRVADLNRVLCPLGNPHPAIGPYRLRPNGITVSPVGSRAVWRWLAPIARHLAGEGK
jgi:hypothetical protein